MRRTGEGEEPPALSQRRVVIESSGFAEGPAQALARYLRREHVPVTTIAHPLVAEGPSWHEVSTWEAGDEEPTLTRRARRPNRPPLTYLFDPFTPPLPPKASVWFAFNNLAAARGLMLRRLGAVQCVVYWAVDFVPDRFGPGALSAVYDRVDRMVCRSVDLRVELSEAAATGRSERLRLEPSSAAPVHVVPMGAWLDRVPTTSIDSVAQRRVVFLGHLVPRMGVELLLDAVERLNETGVVVDIIGGGPLLEVLRRRVEGSGLGDVVTLHGFVPDHRAVEQLLSRCAVAVAPYQDDPSSFTRFADPGKLKSYLAAGLPIVLTDVPPNARILEREAGARIVPPAPDAIAAAIDSLLQDPADWAARHAAALAYIRQFDWPTLLAPVVERVLPS